MNDSRMFITAKLRLTINKNMFIYKKYTYNYKYICKKLNIPIYTLHQLAKGIFILLNKYQCILSFFKNKKLLKNLVT